MLYYLNKMVFVQNNIQNVKHSIFIYYEAKGQKFALALKPQTLSVVRFMC